MEVPLKKLTFVATALALVAFGGAAQAQRYTNYPVCAVYSARTVSCAFNNLAQCQMSVSGRGGFCEPNPNYEPPRKRVRRLR